MAAVMTALILITGWALRPPAARACVICALGDPTLTTMGLEKPVSGRKRVSLTGHHRSMEDGTPGIDQVQSDEQRLDLAFLWAPTRWLAASVHLPLVRKHRSLVSGAEETAWGLGELSMHARFVVWQGPAARARHVLSVETGVTLPTAPTLLDTKGERLEADLQAGLGSVSPQLGLAYGFFNTPWALFVSTSVQRPLASRFDLTLGGAWLSTVMVQRSLGSRVSLQAGADSRWAQANQRSGIDEPNSGGFVVAGSLGAVWSPISDLVLQLTVRIPGLQLTTGESGEGPSALVGVSYDL